MTDNDTDLASKALMLFNVKGSRVPVAFQFPPKVTSDNRSASWEEKSSPGLSEPLVTFLQGSSAREISLDITYIVDGNIWTCSKIKDQINLIRGYYARVEDSQLSMRNLVIYLKLWCIGGKDPLSFRMKSCNVKYSETMVKTTEVEFNWLGAQTLFNTSPSSPLVTQRSDFNSIQTSGLNYSYFPLRTDISLSLASWTKFNPEDRAWGDGQSETGPRQVVPGLKNSMPVDWY